MHDKMCGVCVPREKNDTFSSLKKEYDHVKYDISNLKDMGLSEELMAKVEEELQQKINEIKERMHNYIDTL